MKTQTLDRNTAESTTAYEAQRQRALALIAEIEKALKAAKRIRANWAEEGSMEHYAHQLSQVADEILQRGEFADEPVGHPLDGCPACGSGSFHTITTGQAAGLVQCDGCGRVGEPAQFKYNGG